MVLGLNRAVFLLKFMLTIMARQRRVDSTSPPRCPPIGRLASVDRVLSRSLCIRIGVLSGALFIPQAATWPVHKRVTLRDA